jgi:alanyl-tRNA synthetase
MSNHTATHVLNWALREVLEIDGGGKVDQKGSLVDPDKTRFDFSHNKPLTREEVERIENLCNEQIKADYPVYTQEVTQGDARKINTLRAVFGEKYPDEVRVISIGVPIGEIGGNDPNTLLGNPDNQDWMKYSVEFCGGTHVKRTGEIGSFVLTAEESVAKGVRRVVGITGEKANQAREAGKRLWDSVKAIATSADITTELAKLQIEMAEAEIPLRDRVALRNDIAELQQLVKKQSKQQAVESAGALKSVRQQLLDGAERVNGSAIVVGELPESPVEQIREAADWLRTQAGSAAVCLGAQADGKPVLIAAMTDDLVAKGLKAGDLIKDIVSNIDGRGGGKPNLAQAGGNNPAGIPNALVAAKNWIKERLK